MTFLSNFASCANFGDMEDNKVLINSTVRKFRTVLQTGRCGAVVLAALIIFSIAANASTRVLSTDNGLSNNAVYNIVQDDHGLLYIGTLDGLNIWDGHRMERFQAADGRSYFEGNKIKHLYQTAPNRIYALTRHGLAKIDTQTKDVVFIDNFDPESVIDIDSNGNIFAITGDNSLQFYNTSSDNMAVIEGFRLDKSDYCYRIVISDTGVLHIFSKKGTWRITLTQSADTPNITNVENLERKHLYVSQPHCGNPIYTITEDFKIVTFDPLSGGFTKICSFTPPVGYDYSRIKGVAKAPKGYWINFWEQLFFLPEGSTNLEPTDITYHSFTIVHDRFQPILWIGTDSQGLIGWNYQEPTMKHLIYRDLPCKISMPARCIHADSDTKVLLFGTKGDGLVRVRDFSKNGEISEEDIDILHTGNSVLSDNSVYCISENHHGCLLIGTEGRHMHYYKNGRLGRIKGSARLSHIYSMAHQNDSTLWVVTGRDLAYRCHTTTSDGIPSITAIDSIEFRSTLKARTQIFNMEIQNDSTIWFGSKGHGCLIYHTNTGKSELLHFPKEYGVAINEITQISNYSDMAISTRNNIAIYNPERDLTSIIESPTHISTKATLKDSKGNLWISTSSGITVLDSNYRFLKSYGKLTGMPIPEYSDRACYRDDKTGTMFYGGINGLTIIDDNIEIRPNDYLPQIHITSITSNNQKRALEQSLVGGRLKLSHSNSAFSVSFSAIDHINPQDYSFLYCLEGNDGKWHKIEGHTIHFPALEPGNYTLKIKYINSAAQTSGPECSLPIRIVPPIYRSLGAYILYVLALAASIWWLIARNRRKQEAAKEEIRNKYRERIRNIKADTSAAISEDISVTTTFILGLCQQIHARTANIPSISEKVSLVEYNVGKIGRTLNMWNELRNVSEDPSNADNPTLVSISRSSKKIIDIATTTARSAGIKVNQVIPENIVLATDKEQFLTFFNALTKIIFDRTTSNGNILYELSQLEHGRVMLKFSFSTDAGTYRLLAEEQGDLSVCLQSAERMRVRADHSYSLSKQEASVEVILQSTYTADTLEASQIQIKENPHHDSIFIISKNSEIISFLNYFMSERYNLSVFASNEDAIAGLNKSHPIIIIYDASSLQGQITDFMARLNTGKKERLIPVITLLSSLASQEKEICLKAGCDICLAFPFNVDTFLSSIDRLIGKKGLITEYYNSPDSSFVLEEGKTMHKEDQVFLRKIVEIIDTNMADPNLTAPIIAEKMGIGVRVLYRRIESLTDKSLRTIIIESRMRHAAKLIASTNLNIDEIMLRTGHQNPGTFYRNFKNYHGMTTKEYREQLRKI